MKKRPLKIAILADALDYQYAGIYYYTKELIKALSKIDSYNQYYIVRAKSEGHLSENVREVIIPKSSLLGADVYRIFYQLPKYLTKLQVDIVFEPRHFGPFNLPKHIKRITFIHDLSPLHFPEWHTFVSRTLQKNFLPSILKNTHHILTNSEFTKTDVIKNFPTTKNKTTATLLGKESFFQPIPNAEHIKSLGITAPYLLHVGTIEPRKNLITLLKAFEQYKIKNPSTLQLVLVGKRGWKNKEFFKALEKSPFRAAIHLLGYVERSSLIALYSSAEAFIYPSFFEGFGLPIVEAMSCACPVICSNVSSLPEIGEGACLYFSPINVDQLITQIDFLLKNPSQKAALSQLAVQQAAKFSWERTAKETLTIFENIKSL